MVIDGRYFFPHSARFTGAVAAVTELGDFRVVDRDGAMLADVPFRKVRVSARLANIARRFALPDGASFETYDNDGVDELMREARRFSGEGVVDKLERSWRIVAVSVVLAGLAGWAFIVFGIPAIAVSLAVRTPPSVAVMMSDQTLSAMDRIYLQPSKLSAADRLKAQGLFDLVAQEEPRGKSGYQLLFRAGGAFGANAFALPDGRIVMTDELWKMFKNADETEGVFAHEMAHVNHAHGLTAVYEASLIPAAIAVVTGDLSQVSQLSVILPGVLLQSAYSRGAEQQADDDAGATLLRMGGHPSRLAAFLERLDRKVCGKKNCGPNWLGNHPEASLRAQRLRDEEQTGKN